MELQCIDNLAGLLGQSVLAHQRQHSQLGGCEGCRQLQHDACLAILQLLFGIGVAHDAEEHTVDANRCLDDIRRVALVGLRVEVFDALA